MKCKEIITFLDDWAPPGIAWEKDNVGLQVGSPEAEIQKILLCLELTPEILVEAQKRKCNLIITHHPFLFHSIKRVNLASDETARLLATLIKNDISVLSYHTNLDYTSEGVSFQLAKALNLKNVRTLAPAEGMQSKLVVYVPATAVDEVAKALYAAGAGKIGEYSGCSFRVNGEGTFIPSDKANPAVGKPLQSETVSEIRLETVIANWNVKKAIQALHEVHPYEEPAYDIFALRNKSLDFGAGTLGELPRPMESSKFLTYVKRSLKLKNFRFNRGKQTVIKTVALCGGSGSEYLNASLAQRADAFITADIRYHSFHDALGKMWMIDAGHYETEIMVLDEVARRLKARFPGITKNIFITDLMTNPVEFYK